MIETVRSEPRCKRRKITLHKNNIVHDIDVLSYKLAETSVDEPARDNVASDSETGLDGAVIAKLMDAREASLRKKLGFCLEDEEIIEIDNTEDLEPDYVFELRLPIGFDDKELKTAVRLMHDYLVKGTLLDWYVSIGTNFGAPLTGDVLLTESKVVDIFRKPGFVNHPDMIYWPSYKVK